MRATFQQLIGSSASTLGAADAGMSRGCWVPPTSGAATILRRKQSDRPTRTRLHTDDEMPCARYTRKHSDCLTLRDAR
jgi:hypothetical protein